MVIQLLISLNYGHHRQQTKAKRLQLTKEQRLSQAQEYAKRFTFDTLSEEDLKRLRRTAYKYAI